MNKDDPLPSWLSFTIIIVLIFGVSITIYILRVPEKTNQAIGQYDNRKMTEPIDQKIDRGEGISSTIQNNDELKNGSILVFDNGTTKTTGVFLNGSIR